MVVLTAHYRAKPGMGDKVESALREMMSHVQNEPGCVYYFVNRSLDNSDTFLLFEQYEDENALKRHSETPYFKQIVLETVLPLLEQRERALYTRIQ